ncbi:MAG: methylenetetrahydrofolate reductase [Bacteroidales bacterium]|nr:methylenetetrahydrofolate reductase [NAD(P)H] [Bacteroidales bacterium]MBR0037158.1 methylenetetrahydrofolate reductase [NAD(P)H] [Bacteroidales bacterium]
MSVASFLQSPHDTAFSFEILPPVKGKSIEQIYKTIDRLREFGPAYINITTHRSDTIYRETSPGNFVRLQECHRPGTVAIAAAIKEKYGITVVPHLICSGYSQQETEYELIDLSFIDITDVILLRGDKSKDDSRFIPKAGGLLHASELCEQVNRFNQGLLIDGSKHEMLSDGRQFSYGVAGYPEKHEEAMNLASDLEALKSKVDKGAGYVVTQMFFDNQKYFAFVDRCRKAGISVPIVPGIKPLGTLNHRTMIPKTFHIDFPEALAKELAKCTTNDEVKQVGIDWCVAQCRELKKAGVPSIHFYSMNASDSIAAIVKQVY